MEINLGQILLQMVNFGILVFILTKFLYGPVLKILQQRAEKVAAGMKAAEQNITEREALEERKREELLAAEKEAAKVLEAATEKAKRLGKDIVEEARKEAQEVAKREQQQFEARLLEQEKQLKQKISELVISTTEAVLVNGLSDKDRQEIVNRQIGKIKKLH